MSEQLEENIYCPYCGEKISVLIDPSEEFQTYIEDCQVCCRPINFSVEIDDDGVADIRSFSDND